MDEKGRRELEDAESTLSGDAVVVRAVGAATVSRSSGSEDDEDDPKDADYREERAFAMIDDDDEDEDSEKDDSGEEMIALKGSEPISAAGKKRVSLGEGEDVEKELKQKKKKQRREREEEYIEVKPGWNPVKEDVLDFIDVVMRGVCPIVLSLPEAEKLSSKSQERLLRYLNEACNRVMEAAPALMVPPAVANGSHKFTELTRRTQNFKIENEKRLERVLEGYREIEKAEAAFKRTEEEYIALSMERTQLEKELDFQQGSSKFRRKIPRALQPFPHPLDDDITLHEVAKDHEQWAQSLELFRTLPTANATSNKVK